MNNYIQDNNNSSNNNSNNNNHRHPLALKSIEVQDPPTDW